MSEADQSAALLGVLLGVAPRVVPDAASWEDWIAYARRERVVPLLYRLVDAVPTDLSDVQREEIAQLHGATLARCVQLEHHLIVVSTLLSQHGIRSAVLKGGATAHLDYPDPSWREVNDIDVLVEPTGRSRAIELLGREGWTQGYPLPRHHEEFTHAVTLVHDWMELDLHQRVARRAVGLLVPPGELLDGSVGLRISGADLRALGDDSRLIHAALHVAVARGLDRRLSSVADVLLAASRRSHRAAKALAQAECWRVRSLVERAIRDSYEAAQLPLPARWAAAIESPIRQRDHLVDAAYLSASRRPLTAEIAFLRLLPGWRSRWDYVLGYFETSDEYSAQHGRSGALDQARYVLSKLRSR